MKEYNLISRKWVIVIGIIIALLLNYIGIPDWISILIALIVCAILANTKLVDSGNKPINEKKDSIRSFNFNGIFKIILYAAMFLAILYYVVPAFTEFISGGKEKPLNEVFYVKSQSGNGTINISKNQEIRFTSGSAENGTTFILRTKTTETGWPGFTASTYASKEGSTLKISFFNMDSSSGNMYFSKIKIPTKQGFGYGITYRINNARAVIGEGKRYSYVDNINTPYQKNPIRHNIEMEVLVAPNSYVYLSNIKIPRGG